jgi:hypothetical protein
VRDAAQQPAQLAHVRGCGGVVPGDVPDHHDRVAVGVEERVVPVAADAGRLGGRDVADDHPGALDGRGIGEQAALQALDQLGHLALPVDAVDGPAGLHGHLVGGREVVGGERPSRVQVQGEDADGAVLRGQRQHDRRLEAQCPQQVVGRAG